MAAKNVLIVFAHQDPYKSFNGALKDEAVKILQEGGHKVEVSDLYDQKWDPRATKNDFTGSPQNEESFSYVVEQAHAAAQGKLTEDIVSEQEKLKTADLVIFQFPMYWFSVPAILKGWFDKVFAGGVTHAYPANVYENGFMKGKKALLSFTTGGPQSMYTSEALNVYLRARRLSYKLLIQGYVCDRLTSSLRKFYGRYGELVIHYDVPLSRMVDDILS
ncbi:hypothetical protein FSP39_007675 [Pinctada imbricata]|uniref:Flavodoxin-like fold domain-containing protein n=1 Tax=Pinctada imbricata TaxID=66713 RepID=A0AA88XVV8_PINIB|nr:hypothetical protein FSP39_007675 [Pinctada imbricata]